MRRRKRSTAERSTQLELVQEEKGLAVIDRAVGHWMVRLEPVSLDRPPAGAQAAMAGAVVKTLAEMLPDLRNRLPVRSDGIRVVFSAQTRQALRSGKYTLMSSSNGVLPVAVDSATRATAEIARVAPNTAVGVGGGVAVAATAANLWPIVLAAGVATAAAWAEQRWLERTFGDLQAALRRVEARLRDDDHGAITAADRLVNLLAKEYGAGVPPLLAAELAAARQAVERVYWARRRYVERLKAVIEQRQDAHEIKTGERSAWAGGTAGEFADDESGVVDELVVFVSAMITRARATAVTASALAADGHSRAALHIIDELEESLREDYHDLYRRMRALAREPATTARWRRLVPLLSDNDDADRAHAIVGWLSEEMDRTVGAALPEREELLVLTASSSAA